jgi:hypothetical protein
VENKNCQVSLFLLFEFGERSVAECTHRLPCNIYAVGRGYKSPLPSTVLSIAKIGMVMFLLPYTIIYSSTDVLQKKILHCLVLAWRRRKHVIKD